MNAAGSSRSERRKARTRAALVSAARRILVERGTTDVAVQDITDEADVGLGSFYNHFESKAELFTTAVSESLEELGLRLDEVAAHFDDPVDRFAVGVRMTVSLADSAPAVAQILVQAGFDYLVADSGLAPRALRDIQEGMAAGRFKIDNPQVGLAMAAGCVFGHLKIRLERPGMLDQKDGEDLAELLLRLFGVSPGRARTAAHRPLPDTPHD